MIRSVHKLIVAATEEQFEALRVFFADLGLEPAESWDGQHSRGAKFQAPAAGVEVGFGHGFPEADLVLEVDNADAYYSACQSRRASIVTPPEDTAWGARIFTVVLPGNAGRVAIFSYNEPAEPVGTAGDLDARGKRFGVVVARFNAFITERLLEGALDALRRSGANTGDIEVVRVPGSFEIPIAARTLAETRRFHAIVCIGCLLRGDTAHYDVIVNEVTRGIGQSSQDTGIPHAFGVLTCDTLDQAIDRAGLKMGNKGFEAGLAAVEMASLQKKVRAR